MDRTVQTTIAFSVFLAAAWAAAAENAPDPLVALRTGTESSRLAAIQALASRGNKTPGAIEALTGLFGDSSARIRVQAADALGQLGPAAKNTTASVGGLLADQNVHVRRAAVRTLRKIRPDPKVSVPLWMKALHDPDSAVRVAALDGLAESGRAAVAPLVESLSQPQTAYWACLALGELGAEAAPAVPALRALVNDSRRSEVRREAALTLGAIGPEAAVAAPELTAALADTDQGVRLAAVFAVGRIGPPASAADEPLRKIAASAPPPFLRTLVAWAQARIHPNDPKLVERALPLLTDAMWSKEPRIRVAAARALIDLHAPVEAIVPPIKQIITKGTPDILEGALRVAASLGEPGVPLLVDALQNKDVRTRAVALLGRMGTVAKAASPKLIELLKDKDPLLRREVLMALGGIGPAARAGVPAAISALNDTEPSVRYSACFALGRMGVVASAAKPALQRGIDSDDPFFSLASAWAMARIDPDCTQSAPKSVPLLIQALDDPEPMVRLEAASSLRCLGPQAKQAAPALMRVSREDPSDLIRDMAMEALRALSEQ